MEKGYFKEVKTLVDYEYKEIEHYDDNNKLLYIENLKIPIYETKEVWIEYTQKELYLQEMNDLKNLLFQYDYKTSKYVDGEYTQKEWDNIVKERKQIRTRIRELEKLLEG